MRLKYITQLLFRVGVALAVLSAFIVIAATKNPTNSLVQSLFVPVEVDTQAAGFQLMGRDTQGKNWTIRFNRALHLASWESAQGRTIVDLERPGDVDGAIWVNDRERVAWDLSDLHSGSLALPMQTLLSKEMTRLGIWQSASLLKNMRLRAVYQPIQGDPLAPMQWPSRGVWNNTSFLVVRSVHNRKTLSFPQLGIRVDANGYSTALRAPQDFGLNGLSLEVPQLEQFEVPKGYERLNSKEYLLHFHPEDSLDTLVWSSLQMHRTSFPVSNHEVNRICGSLETVVRTYAPPPVPMPSTPATGVERRKREEEAALRKVEVGLKIYPGLSLEEYLRCKDPRKEFATAEWSKNVRFWGPVYVFMLNGSACEVSLTVPQFVNETTNEQVKSGKTTVTRPVTRRVLTSQKAHWSDKSLVTVVQKLLQASNH